VPFIDISAGGDEIGAVVLTDPAAPARPAFDQLPGTSAVASVTVHSALHIYSDATEWRHDVLTPAERSALTPAVPCTPEGPPDGIDRRLLAALSENARLPAAALATATGLPDSTVRRRLSALADRGHLRTLAAVDPYRLGLTVDANIWMRVPPDRLDAAGRALAAHPSVHGTLATTGATNLHVAVWARDRAHLYGFLTTELAGLGVHAADTVLVGRAVKRPCSPVPVRRTCGDVPGAVL
jgi:DNA-binding Lrp family transcriptional regulator